MSRIDRPLRKVTCSARVRVTLDLDLTDAWNGECRLQQITEQATDAAKAMLGRWSSVNHGVQLVQIDHVRVSVIEEGER